MRAMRVSDTAGMPLLVDAEVARPQPDADEVLVQVCAAGVTPSELLWYPTTHTPAGERRSGAIPGHEFSGIVAGLGANVRGLEPGQAVYGMNDWFADGATAEYCVARSQWLAPKPASLTHEAAATVPIAALTAWQGLVMRAQVHAGQRVLVHGGAGAVGLFVVQIAKQRGAHVIATASQPHLELVRALGADEALDYRRSRFEDAGKMDVVFDTVGGDTLARSWQVLQPEGRLITIAAQGEAATEQRVKEAFFIVEPDGVQLAGITRLFDQGALRTFVKVSVPLERAAEAYSGAAPGMLGYGKAVVTVAWPT